MTRRTWSGRYVAWLVVPLILAGAVAAWLVVDPGFPRDRGNTGTSTDVPKDEFERRVRDYLLAHPDVIIQSVNQLEASQRAKAETEVQEMIKSRASEIFQDAAAPTSGNPNGAVTLVEFFDYNCPYCRQVAPVMAKAEEADPQLRIAYKEFAILGPNSTFAAKAALGANKQGKYVAFHRGLYGVRGAVDAGKVREVAAAVGLDMDRRIPPSRPRSIGILRWPRRSASTVPLALSSAAKSCAARPISNRYRPRSALRENIGNRSG